MTVYIKYTGKMTTTLTELILREKSNCNVRHGGLETCSFNQCTLHRAGLIKDLVRG